MSKEKYERALNDNRIIFGKAGKTKPQYKRFENEAKEKGVNSFTIWDFHLLNANVLPSHFMGNSTGCATA
jgi:hypothetical protein